VWSGAAVRREDVITGTSTEFEFIRVKQNDHNQAARSEPEQQVNIIDIPAFIARNTDRR